MSEQCGGNYVEKGREITVMRKPITPEQLRQMERMGTDLSALALGTAIAQLENDGVLSGDGLQRVLGKGYFLRRKLVAAWKTTITELAEEKKLRLISGGKKVVIPACDGNRNFVTASEIFTWDFDVNFIRWGLDAPSDPTPETTVEVYEMVENGNFKAVLDSTGEPVEMLFFTQAQAEAFVEANTDWLCNGGYAMCIPFKQKVNGVVKFFVALVSLGASGRLSAHVHEFSSYGSVLHADNRLRFVLPQLTATVAD